jgi:hypothetical protein
MAIQIIDNFKVNATKPIDIRMVASSQSDLETIENPYNGLVVFVLEDQKLFFYYNSSWSILGSDVDWSDIQNEAFFNNEASFNNNVYFNNDVIFNEDTAVFFNSPFYLGSDFFVNEKLAVIPFSVDNYTDISDLALESSKNYIILVKSTKIIYNVNYEHHSLSIKPITPYYIGTDITAQWMTENGFRQGSLVFELSQKKVKKLVFNGENFDLVDLYGYDDELYLESMYANNIDTSLLNLKNSNEEIIPLTVSNDRKLLVDGEIIGSSDPTIFYFLTMAEADAAVLLNPDKYQNSLFFIKNYAENKASFKFFDEGEFSNISLDELRLGTDYIQLTAQRNYYEDLGFSEDFLFLEGYSLSKNKNTLLQFATLSEANNFFSSFEGFTQSNFLFYIQDQRRLFLYGENFEHQQIDFSKIDVNTMTQGAAPSFIPSGYEALSNEAQGEVFASFSNLVDLNAKCELLSEQIEQLKMVLLGTNLIITPEE